MIQTFPELHQLMGGLDTAGGVETYVHYNGEVTLYYDHKTHIYYKLEDGERQLVAGVTNVTSMLDKSGALSQWSANEMGDYIATHVGNDNVRRIYQGLRDKLPWEDLVLPEGSNELITISTADLAKLLNEGRFHFRTIQKDATDIGTIAHNWLEDCLKSMIAGVHHTAALPSNEFAQRSVTSALEWMAKHKFRPTHSENKCYSRTYGHGGTFDWKGYVTGCGDGKCCPFSGEVYALGDFKTSKSIHEDYYLQTAAYQQAVEEEHGEQIAVRVILRLGKTDGEFESRVRTFETYEQDFDGFLGLLAAYYWKEQLDLNATAEKKLAKAAARAAKLAEKATKGRRAPKKAVIPEGVIA